MGEEEAMQLCNESDAVMLHTKRECASANAESMTCLARRVDETDDLRRQLEQQLSETASAISHTERSITKTMKKLKDHEQPLRILDKQFDLRNKRTSREGIRDPVTEELESHLETVKSAVKMHTTKWQSMNDVLQQLKSSKLRIVEDLRCKTLAQRIDDACGKREGSQGKCSWSPAFSVIPSDTRSVDSAEKTRFSGIRRAKNRSTFLR